MIITNVGTKAFRVLIADSTEVTVEPEAKIHIVPCHCDEDEDIEMRFKMEEVGHIMVGDGPEEDF